MCRPLTSHGRANYPKMSSIFSQKYRAQSPMRYALYYIFALSIEYSRQPDGVVYNHDLVAVPGYKTLGYLMCLRCVRKFTQWTQQRERLTQKLEL